jgi:hypothetical protein
MLKARDFIVALGVILMSSLLLTTNGAPQTSGKWPAEFPPGAPKPIAEYKMPQFTKVLRGSAPGNLSDIKAKLWVKLLNEVFAPQMTARQVPMGYAEGVRRMLAGEERWAACNAGFAYDTFVGRELDKKPHPNLRLIGMDFPSIGPQIWVVLRDSRFWLTLSSTEWAQRISLHTMGTIAMP